MLRGERINLRTVRADDMAEYIENALDISQQCEFFPRSLTTETRLRASFDRDGMWNADYGVLLIEDLEENRIVGNIMHFKPVSFYDCCEIGYIVYREEDRGKGYATEASRMMIKYLFDLKQIFRIQIQCSPLNIPSNKVAERLGFMLEGTLRQAYIAQGEARDINLYSLLRSEFEAQESYSKL